MYLPRIDITLPIENATLISATVGENALPFENSGADFQFFPDGKWFADGEHVIELIWQFPLENLELADYGYQVPLQSLIPVTSYKIAAILGTNCGFTWKHSEEELRKAQKRMPSFDPDNPHVLTLFTLNGPQAKTTFGTCGLCIKHE